VVTVSVCFHCVAEGQLSPGNRLVRFGPFAFFLVKTAHAEFGDADAVRFERFPNQLAAQTDSRIITARLDVAHEMGHGRFLPTGDRTLQ